MYMLTITYAICSWWMYEYKFWATVSSLNSQKPRLLNYLPVLVQISSICCYNLCLTMSKDIDFAEGGLWQSGKLNSLKGSDKCEVPTSIVWRSPLILLLDSLQPRHSREELRHLQITWKVYHMLDSLWKDCVACDLQDQPMPLCDCSAAMRNVCRSCALLNCVEASCLAWTFSTLGNREIVFAPQNMLV